MKSSKDKIEEMGHEYFKNTGMKLVFDSYDEADKYRSQLSKLDKAKLDNYLKLVVNDECESQIHLFIHKHKTKDIVVLTDIYGYKHTFNFNNVDGFRISTPGVIVKDDSWSLTWELEIFIGFKVCIPIGELYIVRDENLSHWQAHPDYKFSSHVIGILDDFLLTLLLPE